MEWRRSPKKKRGEKKRRLLRLGAKKKQLTLYGPRKGHATKEMEEISDIKGEPRKWREPGN